MVTEIFMQLNGKGQGMAYLDRAQFYQSHEIKQFRNLITKKKKEGYLYVINISVKLG